ncbi:MAG: transposase [Anaerolineae bacterium]|nr:transposase [Anaerolineae bacterium]
MPGYDYASSGAYFVTICTHQRAHLFGRVESDRVHLSPWGFIAEEELRHVPERWNDIDLDVFVVMPNHVHLIVLFQGDPATPSAKPPPTLGHVVGNYKAGVTRRIQHELREIYPVIWQTRYHDHIIRTQEGYDQIRQYVVNNPAQWSEDRFYSARNL